MLACNLLLDNPKIPLEEFECRRCQLNSFFQNERKFQIVVHFSNDGPSVVHRWPSMKKISNEWNLCPSMTIGGLPWSVSMGFFLLRCWFTNFFKAHSAIVTVMGYISLCKNLQNTLKELFCYFPGVYLRKVANVQFFTSQKHEEYNQKVKNIKRIYQI